MEILKLKTGQAVTSEELDIMVGGNRQSAVRISKEKKIIALLVNYKNSSYDNHWEGNLLYFSTMGSRRSNPLESFANQRIIKSAEEGFTVVIFERYSSELYYYRGVVELLNAENIDRKSADVIQHYVFQQVRHKWQPQDFQEIFQANISILHDEEYWIRFADEYEDERGQFRSLKRLDSRVDYSLWRAYAAEVLDGFASDIEERGPEIIVPQYDLERGSIKGTLTVCAAVATVISSSVTTVARYPEVKENLPILLADASDAFSIAVQKLKHRYPKAFIRFNEPPNKPSPRNFNFPTMGPALSKRREDLDKDE